MQVKAPLYVTHVSGKQSADILSNKLDKNQLVYGEVLASALGLIGDNQSVDMVTSPPLRSNHKIHNHLMELLAS